MRNDYKLENISDIVLNDARVFYVKVYYSLSIDEKIFFKELVLNKSCLNCTNGSCRVESYEKDNSTTCCLGWENPEMVGRQRVLN